MQLLYVAKKHSKTLVIAAKIGIEQLQCIWTDNEIHEDLFGFS